MKLARLLHLALVAATVLGQVQIDQSRGNECRHTCILSRVSPQSIRSTPCNVPVQFKLRKKVSLPSVIDDDSKWVLNHTGSINAQIIYLDNTEKNRAVWFLSQKSCMDFGDARGWPATAFYSNISTGPESASPGLLGDWKFKPEKGDIFKGCVEHTKPWKDLLLKSSEADRGISAPRSFKQYMKIHSGKHEGVGTRLTPYEFSYSIEDLERVFQFALDEAERSKDPTVPAGEPVTNLTSDFLRNLFAAAEKANRTEQPIPPGTNVLESGKPVLLRGFPFENGLSIVTNETIDRNTPRPDLVQDIEAIAYNRLQEEVASTAAGPAPRVLLPEAIKKTDLLYTTAVAVSATLAFIFALKSTTRNLRELVLPVPRPKQELHWAYVTDPSGDNPLEQYMAPATRKEMYGAIMAFSAAVIGIVAAVLTFRDSGLRFRMFLVIRQGYLVTYAASDPAKWAVDTRTGKSNQNAGARFIVGVWLKAQFEPVGTRWVFEAIVVLYVALGAGLLFAWHRFSILQEPQLTWARFRGPMQASRGVIQMVTGGIARIPLAGRAVKSYLSEYRRMAREISRQLGVDGFTERVSFTKMWDGTLELPPRPRRMLREESPDEDHCEKCAAFLAAEKFGRLSYPQLLAYLSKPHLVRNVDRYHRTGVDLSAENVVTLSRMYSIKGVLFPVQSNAVRGIKLLDPRRQITELSREDFRVLGSDVPMSDTLLGGHRKAAALLALPEDGAADAQDRPPQFAVVRIRGGSSGVGDTSSTES